MNRRDCFFYKSEYFVCNFLKLGQRPNESKAGLALQIITNGPFTGLNCKQQFITYFFKVCPLLSFSNVLFF